MLSLQNRNTVNSNFGGGLTLQSIFDNNGLLHQWTSENITIDGTTTTLHDYAGTHDLFNPAAANQATFNASSANFNGKPSFTLDGTTDYFHKAVANWRAADSTGVMIVVVKQSGTENGFFTTADDATNTNWFGVGQALGKGNMLKSGANHITSLTDDAGAKVISASGDGANLKIFLNGVDNTDTTGTYSWLDSQPTLRDNIVIGSVQRLSPLYANMELVAAAYMPYTNDAAIIAAHSDYMTYYGIS